jgi:hypothetical protein
MATKINLVIQGAYAMPSVCVSCGAPAGTETISAGGSDFSGKHLAYLRFPICDACAEARSVLKWPRRWGHIGGFFGGFVLGMLLSRLGYIVAPSDWWALLGITVTILGVILGGRWSSRKVPEDAKGRDRALSRAVAFKKYRAKTFGVSTAVIEFENDTFAHLFCLANPVVAMPVGGFASPVVQEPPIVSEPELPPSGWYPDPGGAHDRRWWDGTTWTEHVEDAGVPGTDASH